MMIYSQIVTKTNPKKKTHPKASESDKSQILPESSRLNYLEKKESKNYLQPGWIQLVVGLRVVSSRPSRYLNMRGGGESNVSTDIIFNRFPIRRDEN